MPGRRHAGRRPTSVTSWWRFASARARARAWASEPPTVERSFFAMTTRMASRNLGERLADVSVGVSERSGVRFLDAVDHTLPIPLFPQLQRSGLSHRRAKLGIVEEPLDGARHVAGTLADAEAVDAVGDHLAERRDVAADDGTLVQPCLEVADAEGLVQRGHREDIACVQRGGFLESACSLDVDDALVRVASELVDEARVKTGDTDEYETGVGVPPPDHLRGIEEVDVSLVPLLASDIEDERSARRNAVRGSEGETIVRTHRVRPHARRDDPLRVESLAREPAVFPVGHRGDRVGAAIAREVTRRVAAVELPPVRQWSQNDWSAKRLRDLERAIQVLAADVVDEVAVLGVPLEDVGAHEVDKRGRVGEDTEKAAAGLDLHDLHFFAREDAAIVERLRAYHAHVMPTGGETRRELVREAFGSADARVRALREEELHREVLGGKPRARTRRRFRPDR